MTHSVNAKSGNSPCRESFLVLERRKAISLASVCMLGSINVLIGKDDPRDYRGAGVKRIMVTTIECISADCRSLLPMIIWPAITHRSNWTMFPTPGWHYVYSESGYFDSMISLEWLKRVFNP